MRHLPGGGTTVGFTPRLWPVLLGALTAALERAEGRLTMALLGHPLYAGGSRRSDAVEDFRKTHDLLRRYRVPVVMAGDTHDFEYYRERCAADGVDREMHHFVNGGGAHLSIGTALAWPSSPPVADWAFHPRTDALTAKLDQQATGITRPAWWWIRSFGGWPTAPEMLSGVFDFDHAPFFQSFVAVAVEPSRDRVRLVLHGVGGPLRWRDVQVGGAVVPPGATEDDVAEWTFPLSDPMCAVRASATSMP